MARAFFFSGIGLSREMMTIAPERRDYPSRWGRTAPIATAKEPSTTRLLRLLRSQLR
jgi:hypothetical protein